MPVAKKEAAKKELLVFDMFAFHVMWSSLQMFVFGWKGNRERVLGDLQVRMRGVKQRDCLSNVME